MDKVARFSEQDRRDLFADTAFTRGLHPAVIEKDFWVCWTLKKLFSSPLLGPNVVFKGGTSLSKVHQLIERFSEDIDLVLNWELIGFGKRQRDPWQELPSKTKRDLFNREVNQKAEEYLKAVFHPHLTELIASVPGLTTWVSEREELTIYLRYPAAFSLEALRPEIKLEVGPLAAWVPSEKRCIRSYAAEEYPHLFDEADCQVVAIQADRTFWEKATILHQQAHRTKPMPANYSRHYYDLARMAKSPVKSVALADLDLLEEVIKFKERFYRCSWAHYQEARPGTFRLIPSPAGEKELKEDYLKMKPMFFKEPPEWDEVLNTLQELEQEINSLSLPPHQE
ncbi:MAG: nucleotidyl transferase AbiEii/AbiGii toxin family protein [Opitutales bacterium]|nr:nucleotidyl transferase AbiEii/AbiGii toxin family protein [Opitutales bacterium]